MTQLNLAERIIALNLALQESQLPFAFGGAIALAFCVGEPRTTRDIDVNVFLNVHQFHREQAKRIRWVPFAGVTIPVLAPESLAVFKAMFNRPKDWVDIAEMIRFPGTDWTTVQTALIELVGMDDSRITRLEIALASDER